jgi:hypothetical protein
MLQLNARKDLSNLKIEYQLDSPNDSLRLTLKLPLHHNYDNDSLNRHSYVALYTQALDTLDG